MTLRYSVEELIKAFGPTYQSIDIRSAAVKQGDKWANVYAVVRLSYEDLGDADKRLRSLERRHGVVSTEKFRVSLCSRPFSDWDQLCGELASGIIRVGEVQVHLAQSLSLPQELADLDAYRYEVRPFDSHSWPVAQYRLFPHSQAPLADDRLTREAMKLGYTDMHEAVNLLCELDIRAGQANGYHFSLSVPVFAAITEMQASLKQRRLWVSIIRHRELSALTGVVIIRGPSNVAGAPPKQRIAIDKFSDSGGNPDLRTASASVRLLGVGADDSVEVKLLQPHVGEIHSDRWGLRYLVPAAQRNILFEALKFFCPESEIRRLLNSSHEIRPKKLKPDAAFELHVAWLLGLFGLSTVVLGEYENILVPETKVHRGSIDILAASQRHKMLVLVACTIGAPKEDDFTNLANTAEIIGREVFTGIEIRILGLVCTGVRGFASYKETVPGLAGIRILDTDQLELLLKLLSVGRERDFFSFLDNPLYSELKEPE